MKKTIKEIADDLDIDKQKVYRFIKSNHINEVHRDASTFYYDEAAEKLIKEHFVGKNVSHDASRFTSVDTVNDEVEFLRNELKHRTAQMDMLQKLLDQQQQLTLQANKKIEQLELSLTEEVEEEEIVTTKKEVSDISSDKVNVREESTQTFLQRLFGKRK